MKVELSEDQVEYLIDLMDEHTDWPTEEDEYTLRQTLLVFLTVERTNKAMNKEKSK